MPDILEQGIGWALVLLVLADVFLTVLHARAGTGILSNVVQNLTWRMFLSVSKPFGRNQGAVLSFCGPAILVQLVLVWAALLTLGTGLIFHPELGTGIRASSGDTPTDFVTALYAGGTSIAIVGASDFTPHTSGTRLIFLFNSLVGVSVISLTLTYLMQVYTALQQRNTLGLKVHLMSAETGDAAELVARLGPCGQFAGGYNNLSELATEMTLAKEAHHFYPVLFYFRFREPHYSVSRTALIALDAVSLIRSALDDEKHGWLKEAAAVEQLWRVSLVLVTTLEETFIPAGAPDTAQLQPEPDVIECWHGRYAMAMRRIQQAGIQTVTNERSGSDNYSAARAIWDQHIANLAPSMAYAPEEIDPATNHPTLALGRKTTLSKLDPI